MTLSGHSVGQLGTRANNHRSYSFATRSMAAQPMITSLCLSLESSISGMKLNCGTSKQCYSSPIMTAMHLNI